MRNTEPASYIPSELQEVFNQIEKGRFGHNQDLIHLINTVRYKNDNYLLGQDFKSYIDAQNLVDRTYQNKQQWAKKAILNSLRSGKFSSDRTIAEYANEIWYSSSLLLFLGKSNPSRSPSRSPTSARKPPSATIPTRIDYPSINQISYQITLTKLPPFRPFLTST